MMRYGEFYGLLLCGAGLMGSACLAADEASAQSAQVTIQGVLHEDKNGFFIKIDDTVYDIAFHQDNKADMQKFYTGLEGDMVKVSGSLRLQEVKDGKPYLVVLTSDIARLKNESKRVVSREAVVERPVVIRERYVEHPRGINLPFVHINW